MEHRTSDRSSRRVGDVDEGCLVHMSAMLTDRGITVQTAAFVASVMGAAMLIGRIGTGYLLDRFFASRVAVLLFGGAALGIGLLMIGREPSIAFIGAFLVGLGLGAEVDMIAFLVSRYFGIRSFAEIYRALSPWQAHLAHS
jgi:MFS family permease